MKNAGKIALVAGLVFCVVAGITFLNVNEYNAKQEGLMNGLHTLALTLMAWLGKTIVAE